MRNSGFSLIRILIILAVLIIALAGGVVVWEKKTSPAPTPTPTPQVLPTPTVSPTWTQSCASDNNCPKQFCQPPDEPCAQYYCIQGKCQLVEPQTTDQCSDLNEKECIDNPKCVAVYGPSCPVCMNEVFKKCRERKPREIKKAPWGIIGSLNEEITLTPGQTVNITTTNLSLILLRITLSEKDCFTCPVDTEVEVRNGAKIEKIVFRTPGIATKEWGTHRIKEVFGFQIRLESVQPELVILSVQKL